MTPAPWLAPSGRQVVLRAGGQEAAVVEVGGGLRSYTAGGEDVLDGYGEAELCASGRGQALIPWPNRLEDGAYEWGGAELRTPITEASSHTAIHGLTRGSNWQLAEAGTDWAVMAYRQHPQAGYPWVLDLSITYRLDPAGLTVTASAENRSDSAAPFGMGFHPYLAAFGGLVDDLVVSAPGSSVYLVDSRSLPVAKVPVEGTPFDFRSPRPVGATVLDTGYTDLARQGDGRAVVTITRPAGEGRAERSAELWMDGGYTHLQLFTGDHIGEVGRRRHGLAVEPMTGPANLLRSGDGRLALAPGEGFTASWGITPAWLG